MFFTSRDGSSSVSEMTLVERRDQQKIEEALHASSLRVPRRFVFLSLFLTKFMQVLLWKFGCAACKSLSCFRPPWNARMSAEELDDNERQSFLIWRRSLARFARIEIFLFLFYLSCLSTLKSYM